MDNTLPLQEESKTTLFWQGTLAMMPLSIAVLPWGLLAGSFAIDTGLHPLEGQALSAILFAGSARRDGNDKSGRGANHYVAHHIFHHVTTFSLQRIHAQ